MNTQDNSEKNQSKLYEMTVMGRNYRETVEVVYFGEEIEVILRPLVDEEFLPITAEMQDKLGIDEEEAMEQIEEAKEDADEEEFIDMSHLDKEFVNLMQRAAKLGIAGEDMGHTQEEVDFMVENMVGGLSVEIGGLVLDVSGDVEDAEKFRK